MLEGVICTTHLPLFGETDAIRVKLSEDDHAKVKFLTTTKIAS